MRKVLPPCCESVRTPTATIAVATVVAAALIVPADRATTPSKELFDVDRPSSSLFPPAQDMPVLGTERAEDRLQGYASALALHFGARQDRTLAHYGGQREEAARTRVRYQARAFSRPSAQIGRA